MPTVVLVGKAGSRPVKILNLVSVNSVTLLLDKYCFFFYSSISPISIVI